MFGHTPRIKSRLSLGLSLVALALGGAAAAPKPPPPPIPSGYEPAALRERLAALDSVDIARACGNICAPWAYRGPFGRERSLRSYGRHDADSLIARAIAKHLLSYTTFDTASRMAAVEVDCDPSRAKPIYLLSLHGRGHSTYVVLRFDVEAALCFDSEEPLGMVRLGGAADSLWTTLAEVMDDDPMLRGERPRLPADWDARPFIGDTVVVTQLPKPTWRVPPVFPPAALQMNLAGVVTVQVLVGREGTVKDAYVLSGHPVMRDDALEAIWQWKFKPALSRDGPVAAWVTIPMRFTMK